MLLRLPPGWQGGTPHGFEVEAFVLSGALCIGSATHGCHAYLRRPVGDSAAWESEAGALRVLCRNMPRPQMVAEARDALRLPWQAVEAPHIRHLNAFRKNL
jgi:hypothetical protein